METITKKAKILTNFHNNYIQFFNEMIDLFPNDSDLITIRTLLKTQISSTDVMTIFINRILPIKKMVVDRDDSFFLEKCNLFDELDPTKVNHFKKIWQSNISNEDKDIIWKYFDVLIILTEKYLSY
jgi:hypothetical protein